MTDDDRTPHGDSTNGSGRPLGTAQQPPVWGPQGERPSGWTGRDEIGNGAAGPPPEDPPTDRFFPSAEPAPPRRDRRGLKITAGAAAIVLAATAGAGGATLALRGDEGGSTATTAAASSPVLSGSSAKQPTQDLAKVAAAVSPSVVSITFQSSAGSGEGSGIVLKSDGTILTNNHVVAEAANGGTLTVKTADGKSSSARILGRDPSTDLAVVKANDLSGLTPASLGSNSSLHVGDTVLAIGSPLGLEGSVTSGIVSALHRTVNLGGSEGGLPGQGSSPTATVSDAIQTDAAINPGNSGGPLVDGRGRVVGISTAIATLGGNSVGAQSGSIGLGFAIPIDEAKSVATKLAQGQQPAHPVLGVSITDDPSGGALVRQVQSGSGASKAGIRAGDVITRFDGQRITSGDDLVGAVRAKSPGDSVTVTLTRNGQSQTLDVTLGNGS